MLSCKRAPSNCSIHHPAVLVDVCVPSQSHSSNQLFLTTVHNIHITAFLNHTSTPVRLKVCFYLFLNTVSGYITAKATTAASHLSEAELAPETSILQRGGCDSFDRLPELKCPSVARLLRSHVFQHQAE